MRARAGWAALSAAALLVTLVAGCAHHDGAAPKAPTSSTPSASASLPGTSSGYAEMRKKVDAAESAAAAADRDAADDATGGTDR
ncbi:MULTISPECIES: hypothetical protein [Streptomyces]|uniref:hypothetical protein n=1 Tax=Streptomyces TaxID=1883 RepID=UPI0029B6C8F4|nr:hypothetical protein [Streptomyces sp. WI03-4A]MDX2595243.1 hypothetical protein [Streptomyces sp. WI03-4A]